MNFNDLNWLSYELAPVNLMKLILKLDCNRNPAIYAICANPPVSIAYKSYSSPIIYIGMTKGSTFKVDKSKRRFDQTYKGLAKRMTIHRANGLLDVFRREATDESRRVGLTLNCAYFEAKSSPTDAPDAKNSARDWERALLLAFKKKYVSLPLMNVRGATWPTGYCMDTAKKMIEHIEQLQCGGRTEKITLQKDVRWPKHFTESP